MKPSGANVGLNGQKEIDKEIAQIHLEIERLLSVAKKSAPAVDQQTGLPHREDIRKRLAPALP